MKPTLGVTLTSRKWLPVLSMWPGLAQIWSGQELLGLILAVFFSLNLNACIMLRLVWHDALPGGAATFFGMATVATWLASMAYSVWWGWRCHPDQHRAEAEQLYRDALSYYLRGRWSEARRCCELVLARNESDADALMQLGLSFVRLGDFDQARRAFRQCLDCDHGAKWRWEVERELERLAGI